MIVYLTFWILFVLLRGYTDGWGSGSQQADYSCRDLPEHQLIAKGFLRSKSSQAGYTMKDEMRGREI